jgi:hypothetical protein
MSVGCHSTNIGNTAKPNYTMARHDEAIRGRGKATFISLAVMPDVDGDAWLFLAL